MGHLIDIPENCHSCRFYSESEDGDSYCAVYAREWAHDVNYEGNKPDWCKATHIKVIE